MLAAGLLAAAASAAETPAFTFTTVAGATGYQIYLYDGTTSTYGSWYTTAQVDPLGTGTGTITLPTPFANGTYFWSVRAHNGAGVGPFGPGLWFSAP